jgi:hypothetical protein
MKQETENQQDTSDHLLDKLSVGDVISSVCDHEYITDANWKHLTCRKCNDRIEPKQTVL